LDVANESKGLQKVFAARNNQELTEGYDAWAERYDQDVLRFGYKIPAIVTGLAGRYLRSAEGTILDAGAGTGILGETLKLLGYENLVGIDLSQGMLGKALRKGVYRTLHQMVLGEHLDFPNDTFDGTILVGVFTAGHAPLESFEELIRVTKPGGYIIFSIRIDVYLNEGFKDKQNALERQKRWQLAEVSETFRSLPFLREPQVESQIFVYEVC
jgi:predicted TPR repeat methyltransferase